MANTTDEILANALKRREEILAESEALDSFIETYQRLKALQKEAVDSAVDQLDMWRGNTRQRLNQEELANLLAETRRLILAERRPLKRGDLVRRLEARGFKIPGKDKNKVFGTNVWRSDLFKHIDRHGYWPKDVPLPSEYAQGDD